MTTVLSIGTAGRLAGDFFFCVDTAITLATLRALGHEKTEELEARMVRNHQEHLLLAGMEKLGLGAGQAPDAIRCARYHCLANSLGGIKMRYAVESETKAWIFYETPIWLDSPWSPSMAIAAFRPEFLLGTMQAWHANNGTLLGNAGLAFSVTELITRGDGRDAGYFIDLKRTLDPTDRLLLRFGEEPPDDLALRDPDFDPILWPEERQAKVRRNYAVGYSAARIAWLARETREAAGAVIDMGFRVALFQRSHSLFESLAIISTDPLERAVQLFAAVHRLAGLEVDVYMAPRTARVAVTGSWLDRAPGGLASEERELADAALGRAWAAWCHHLDRGLTCQQHRRETINEWSFQRESTAARVD